MTYTTARPAIRNRGRYIAAPRRSRRPKNKRLARLRTIRRVLRFAGFLCHWAVALGIAYLGMLAFMLFCFWMS